MKVNRSSFIQFTLSFFWGVVVLLFSLWLLPFAIDGDQFYYRLLYDSIWNYDTLSEQFWFYQNTLGTQEPVYFIIGRLFSRLVDKDILIAVLNGFLAILISNGVLKTMYDKFYAVLFLFLLFPSYYFIVLFVSAERLKVSLLFVIIGYILKKKSWQIVFFFLAVLTHTQNILLVLPFFVHLVIDSGLLKNKHGIKVLVGVIVFILILFVILRDHITNKLHAIGIGFDFIDFAKTSLFAILTLFFVKGDRLKIIFSFIPICFASLLLGDERITILAYLLYLSYEIKYLKRLDLIAWLSLLFFCAKSLPFIQNVLQYGNGYYL